ncbi:hypothetical protein ACFL2V_10955 [Pseudomonadota bacterium]
MNKKIIMWTIAFLLIIHTVSAFRIIPNSIGEQMNEGNVKIYWVTDEASTTLVNYGIGNLDQNLNGANSATDHYVFINDLQENEEYSYKAFSCNSENECVESGTRNFIYIVPDNIPPVITLSEVPEKVYETNLEMAGNVNEPVTVTLTINGEVVTSDIPLEGDFSLGLSISDGENNIEILFVDVGGNEVKKTFQVVGDTVPLELIQTNLDQISQTTSETQVVTGQTNKPNADLVIRVGETDYQVTTDADGYFSIEIQFETGSEVVNDIVIYLLRDEELIALYERAVTYFHCETGSGTWFKVNVTDLTPDVIIPEHLLNGIAQFGFRIDLDYRGSGQGLTLGQPMMVDPKLNELQMEDMHEEIIGSKVVQCTQDNKHCYVIINLLPWPGTREELYDKTKWKEIFGTDLMYLNLPLQLSIPFSHEVNGEMKPEHQDMCWFFDIMVDAPITIRPKKTLESSIKVLNDTMEVIDTIREPLNDAKMIAFGGCLGAWAVEMLPALRYGSKCNEVIAGSTAVQAAKTAAANGEKSCAPGAEDTCQPCLDAIWTYRDWKVGKQWLCDRVFCPAVPTIESHMEEYKDPLTGTESACKETSISLDLPRFTTNACKEEFMREWDTAGVFVNEYDKAVGNDDEFFANIDEIVQKSKGICPAVEEFPSQVVNIEGTEYYVDENKQVWIVDCYNPAYDDDKVVHLTSSHSCIKEEGPLTEDQISALPQLSKKLFYEDPENKDYVFDPTSGPIEATRGVCLPAIDGYLNQWRSIAGAVKQCFETILITGEGSSGVCRAVLSQYVCDAIWDGARCLGGGAATVATERAEENKKLGRANPLLVDVGVAFNQVSNSVQDRYGQTSMFDVMFSQKKLIHSACMTFFGMGLPPGFDLQSMLSSDVGMPVLSSEGLVAPANRRFITSNPINHGWATHIYHVGYAIQAGADVSFSLKLVCSNDLSCGGQDFITTTTPDSACDCYNIGSPLERIVDSGMVVSGDLITEERYLKLEDKVRYDKAVLEWEWTDNNGNRQSEKIVKHIGLKGMTPPDYCSFDTQFNEYRCRVVVDEGTIYFQGYPFPVYPGQVQIYSLGDPLKLGGTIMSELKDSNPTPKYLNLTILNHHSKIVYTAQEIITRSGMIKIEELPFWPILNQEMFKDQQDQVDCRDTTFGIFLELFESQVLGDGQHYPSNTLVQANGEVQQKTVPVSVKCSDAAGTPPPEITEVRFIGFDADGLSTYFELDSVVPNSEIYVDPAEPDRITFDKITVDSANEFSVALIVDGTSLGQTPNGISYEWMINQPVNRQTYNLQFEINDGVQTSRYPQSPKSLTIVIP